MYIVPEDWKGESRCIAKDLWEMMWDSRRWWRIENEELWKENANEMES